MKKVFIICCLSLMMIAPALYAFENALQLSDARMEQKMRAAVKKAVAQQKSVFNTLYPLVEEISGGWLLPWQIPAPHRKFKTPEAYWQTVEKKMMGIEGITTLLAEAEPEDFESYLEAMAEALKKQTPADALPSGFDHKRFALATLLTMVQIKFSPGLGKNAELQAGLYRASEKIFEPLLSAAESGDTVSGSDRGQKVFIALMDIILKPYQTMTTEQIGKLVLKEVRKIKKRGMMTYAKCNEWPKLSATNADEAGVLFGQAGITVNLLDRDAVETGHDDRSPEDLKSLQSQLTGGLSAFKKLMTKVVAATAKKDIAALEKRIRETDNDAARIRLREKIEKRKEAAEKQKKGIATFAFKAAPINAGNNCYVIHFSGNTKLFQSPLQLTGLNAYLRNGRAVTVIQLAGNFPPAAFKKDLHHLIDLMDAATLMYRD